ncbi:MAG TPA: hypothetical protein VK843_05355 [Planctomycetota bacterium]|nr:hypothetical protein [Planctomycetota bacterium]
MSKIALIALKAVGGSALFAVSFVGFAKVNGVPLNTLPVVGKLFPADAKSADHSGEHAPELSPAAGPEDAAHGPVKIEGSDETAKPEPAAAHEAPNPEPNKPEEHSKVARAGIFDLLEADGLYTQDELRALAESLRAKNHEADQRGAELDRREDLLADRLNALDDRRRTLDEFAKRLDARDRELKAREAEMNLGGDGGTGKTKEAVPADLAAFFAEGETEVLVKRLAGFTPEESAQILIKLPPTRAKELLDGLPNASWRVFAEAYARAAKQ